MEQAQELKNSGTHPTNGMFFLKRNSRESADWVPAATYLAWLFCTHLVLYRAARAELPRIMGERSGSPLSGVSPPHPHSPHLPPHPHPSSRKLGVCRVKKATAQRGHVNNPRLTRRPLAGSSGSQADNPDLVNRVPSIKCVLYRLSSALRCVKQSQGCLTKTLIHSPPPLVHLPLEVQTSSRP